MTIYILDNDPVACAKALDDRSLDSMIKDIAQVLCNVHIFLRIDKAANRKDVQLLDIKMTYSLNKKILLWADWAGEGKANYLCLSTYGERCFIEYFIRFHKSHKLEKVITWGRDNIPDFSSLFNCTCDGKWVCDDCHFQKVSLILIMPKKYFNCSCSDVLGCQDFDAMKICGNTIASYRNFYQAKLKQRYTKEVFDLPLYEIDCWWTKRTKPKWLNL